MRRLARTLLSACNDARRRLALRLLGQLNAAGPQLSREVTWFRRAYLAKRLVQRSLRCGPRVFGRAARSRLVAEFDTQFWLRLDQLSRPLRRAEAELYDAHIANRRYVPGELSAMRDLCTRQAFQPIVSVLTPTWNAEPAWLDRLFASLQEQAYDRWEWVLVDDGSTAPATRTSLVELAGRDDRIQLHVLPTNQGVVAATNSAAAIASGEFLAFVDHDDELCADSLWHVVRAFEETPKLDVVYTDEEFVPADRPAYPHFKPDFAPENLTACNFVCHLLVVRRAAFESVGGMRAGTDGAQDHDLVLRLSRAGCNIGHVPRVLYRWHLTPSSLSRTSESSHGRVEQVKRVRQVTQRIVAEHFEAMGTAVDVEPVGDWVRPRFLPIDRGRTTIIICTRDQPKLLRRCVESIEGLTDYPNYELLIVDNESQLPEGRRLLDELGKRHCVVPMASGSEGFNFAKLNNDAAKLAGGEYLVFLNDDTEVLEAGWLSAIIGWLQMSGIGAVGAKLLFPNGRIQHAGVIVGAMDWGPWHVLRDLPGESNAFHGYLQLPHNNLAVTGACLATRRLTFHSHGGFDAERYAVCFNDVDYCLRLAKAGLRCVYEPGATLVHHESATRPPRTHPHEAANLKRDCDGLADPYWNVNYSRESYCFEISTRRRRRWAIAIKPRVLAIAARLPSRHESGVAALLEALNAEQPVLDFDVAGLTHDLRELMEVAVRDGCNVALVDGSEGFEAVHFAFAAGMAVVWRIGGRLAMPNELTPVERARFLAALSVPYQVVFDCRHHRLEAERGLPRGNFCTIESMPLGAEVQSSAWTTDRLVHVIRPNDPARSEAAMRAMQLGIPIVGPRAAACADLLQDGVTGLEYREHDEADMAAKVTALESDSTLRLRLGEQAREWMTTRRSLSRVLQDWLELLHEAAELATGLDRDVARPHQPRIGESAKSDARTRKTASRRA